MKRSIILLIYTHSLITSLMPSIGIVNGMPAPKLSRRIAKEIKEMQENPIPGILAVVDDEDFTHFNVLLAGPADSPFEGGVFKLDLRLPSDYPDSPPIIKFLTKVYHPNVNSEGGICLDTIQQKWTPVLRMTAALLSVQALLSEPFLGHFLSVDIGNLWKKDPEKAKSNAREWTKKYATNQFPSIAQNNSSTQAQSKTKAVGRNNAAAVTVA